jgi:hypothetical protein
MEGQWFAQVRALHSGGGNYFQSFQFNLPAQFGGFAIVQISLSEAVFGGAGDPDGQFRNCSAMFSEYTTADGNTTDLPDDPSVFMAKHLTGFSGYLAVANYSARAIINVFTWPSIG